MFKKSLFFLLIVFSLTSFSVFANELDEPLTNEEITILKEKVGLNDEMINDLPIYELKLLIEEGAVLKAHTTEIIVMENPKSTDSDITPNQGGDLDESKIKLDGYAYDLGIVTSGTWKGYRKIKAYGTWEWLTPPANAYTDAFAVGWGDTRIVVPTANNDATEFWANYYRKTGSTGSWYLTQNAIKTSSFEPNSGTGWKFDLRQGFDYHKGDLTQYAYTRATSGDANFKFTYGHTQIVGFTPSFSNGPAFGVTPSIGVKVGYAADTLKW